MRSACKVSVVELTKTLIPGCDRDLVRPLEKRIATRYEAIMLGTRVVQHGRRAPHGITVHFDGDQAPGEPQVYDRVLVAVGGAPNGRKLGARDAPASTSTSAASCASTSRCAPTCRTSSRSATSSGQPMLAHKASHEGKVAAEVAAGQKSFFDARVVPSVAYTDPEVAWVGLTEDEAKARGVAYEKGAFPWAASARSLTLGRAKA